MPDAAFKVEPVFVNPAPLPKNPSLSANDAVTDVIPEILVAPSPIILPPITRSLARPTPPSITTAPLVTAVELVVSLNFAS